MEEGEAGDKAVLGVGDVHLLLDGWQGEAEQRAIKLVLADTGVIAPVEQKEEVATFEEWFHGAFWREWVIGRKNKPGEQYEKQTTSRTLAELAPQAAGYARP